jgi:hypothetical protein
MDTGKTPSQIQEKCTVHDNIVLMSALKKKLAKRTLNSMSTVEPLPFPLNHRNKSKTKYEVMSS